MAMDVGGAKGGVKSDINVTPLCDVMLVLLIIMMIVAPLLQQGVSVSLPKADNTVDKPESQGQTVLSALMPSTVWSCVSGLDALLVAMGSLTSTPFCSSGAMIIMMMRSTSMTSTRGVTLMSDLTPPPPPSCIAIVTTPLDS